MEGILHQELFIDHPQALFNALVERVAWDERMLARKTASFGRAYNYAQMEYTAQDMLPELDVICKAQKSPNHSLKCFNFEP